MVREEILKLIDEKVHGKILPKHTNTEHWYMFVETGTMVRSVTTHNIMKKPWLIKWAIKQGYEWYLKNQDKEESELLAGMLTAYENVRDDAGRIGNVGHEVVENYCNEWIKTGQQPKDIRSFCSPDYDDRVWAVARSAEKIFNETGAIPIASEILVGLEKFNSAGTLDLLVLNKDGQLEIWDWKTTNNIHTEYAIQVSAYKKFFEKMTGLKVKHCKIAHLSKDMDAYDIYLMPNINEAFKMFQNNVDLSLWSSQPDKEKIYKQVRTIRI